MLRTFPSSNPYDTRTALIKWWINSRKCGGLRLTTNGYKLLSTMQYTSYIFSAENLTTSCNLLIMDKKLECPYYLDGLGCRESKLHVFGEREATLINLFNDVNAFIRSL